jgi:AraC-like DNA-binding protein
MLMRARSPGAPLATFVEALWALECSGLPHSRERLLPEGSAEIVINLKEDAVEVFDRSNPVRALRFPTGVVCGPHSEYFLIDSAAETSVVGAHFRPGGSHPFFRPPSGELRNRHVGLEDLWGSRPARRLRERLLEAPNVDARIDVLECALLQQALRPLARPPEVGYALRAFTEVPHVHSVADVTSRLSMTPKRFIGAFEDTVGLTPKVFCRVRRFQHVVRSIHAAKDVNWAEVALACGYYDQPHFIHDFEAFSGLRPTEYLERRTPHLNHVPMA